MIKRPRTSFRLHPLFSVMLVLSVVTGQLTEVLVLFGIVLIHELGHVAAARSFGWRVKEVQLLPFGGVAVVEELGTVPAWEEVIVALAGPLQNVLMIGIVWGLKAAGFVDNAWADYLISANLIIAGFNMLPIMPLDGGKIVQSALTYFVSYHRAIQYCLAGSMFISVILIILALIHPGQPGIRLNLLVIGIFLLVSNWYAYRGIPYHFVRFLMNRESKAGRWLLHGTIARPIVVNGRRKIAEVMRLFMRERYHLIYVMDERGRIQAVLPEQRLLHTYFVEKKPGSAVSELLL